MGEGIEVEIEAEDMIGECVCIEDPSEETDAVRLRRLLP